VKLINKTMQSDLAKQELSREELQQLRNKRSGMTIFQISWIMVFVCLIVVNWQLRSGQVSWPPPGVETPSAVLPSMATLALLVSVWLARGATHALKDDHLGIFLQRWPLVLALGTVFVAIIAYEWVSLPYSGIYSDVFRMMTAFHAVHALVIGVFMGMIYRGARAGQYDSSHFWPVEGATSLWYFVVFAWLLFYVVLYLI
jgi:heme/copper-type cytochrome/quinol oxidase subunit 3